MTSMLADIHDAILFEFLLLFLEISFSRAPWIRIRNFSAAQSRFFLCREFRDILILRLSQFQML